MAGLATVRSAFKAIQKKGVALTLGRAVLTPDGDEPWKTTSAETTGTFFGVLDDYRAAERDGEVIQAQDRRYVLALFGGAIVPKAGDRLEDAGVSFRVVSVQILRSGAYDVLGTLQVR